MSRSLLSYSGFVKQKLYLNRFAYLNRYANDITCKCLIVFFNLISSEHRLIIMAKMYNKNILVWVHVSNVRPSE